MFKFKSVLKILCTLGLLTSMVLGFQNCSKLKNSKYESQIPADPSTVQNESSVSYLPNSIVPEYFPSRAIVFSYGEVFSDSNMLSNGNPILSGEMKKERLDMIATILKNSGDAKGIFIEKQSILDQTTMKNELAQALSNRGIPDSRYKIVGINLKDTYFDQWTRDYVGLPSTSNTGILTLLKTDNRGIGVNPILAAQISPAILSNESNKDEESFQGGNLMTDSKGRCFYAKKNLELPPTISKFCRDKILLPSLPLEGTGHIDLFAKLVNDKQAVVAKYASEQVRVFDEKVVHTYECSDIEFDKAPRGFCERTVMSEPVLKNDATTSKVLPYSTLKSELSKILNDADGEVRVGLNGGLRPLSEMPAEANWAYHSSYSRAILEQAGIETFTINAPIPYVRITKEIYKSSNGRTKVFYYVSFVFRSFINSLVTNNKAFVPVYNKIDDGTETVMQQNSKGETVSMTLNDAAINTYKSLGLEAYAIPTDYSIIGGGSVHCVTHQIPK